MRYILLGLMAFLLPGAVKAQEQSADSVVRSIFKIVKNNDEKGFIAMFPSRLEMKELLNRFNPGRNAFEDSIFIAEAGLDTDENFTSKMQEKFRESFIIFMSQAEHYKINWQQAMLDSIDYKILQPEEFNPMMLKGDFYFHDNRDSFIMPFSDVIWSTFHKKWFGVELGRLRGAKEVDMIDSLDVVVDTLIELQKTVQPPPPPSLKPDKKPAGKKMKEKSTARKQEDYFFTRC